MTGGGSGISQYGRAWRQPEAATSFGMLRVATEEMDMPEP